MAKRMWYHNVPADVLRRGPAPGSQSYRRNAMYRAYAATRDDPIAAGALLKSSMSAPMLDRVAAERSRRRSFQAAGHLSTEGIEPDSAMSEQSRSALAQRKKAEADRRAQESGGFWSGVADFFTYIPRKVFNAARTAGTAGLNALEFAGNALEAPLAAGRASGEPELGGLTDSLSALGKAGYPGTVSGPVSGAVALAQGVVDWAQGAQRITGIGKVHNRDGTYTDPAISPQQQADMRRRGYDPTSVVDRFRWYYHDWMGDGFKPVSDAQVKRAIDEGGATPEEAESAREYLISGVADNPGEGDLAALSKPAQAFARKVLASGADSREGRILAIVDDDPALAFGGTFADAVGLREPGAGRNVTSALADLAGLWYVDPLGAAGTIVTATRAAMWGVQADRLGDVARVIGASHPETQAPMHATGRMMNQMLEDVDNVFLLTQRGEKARQAGKAGDAARDIDAATKLTERFQRLHPDLWRQWDALMQTRSGAVQQWAPRARESMAKESAKATERNREIMPLEAIRDDTRTPAWSIRNNLDIQLTDPEKLAKLAPIRARQAEEMELLILQEAMASGRPMFRGKVILPGRVTMGRRARQVTSPLFDALARQNTKLRNAVNTIADNPRATTSFEDFAGGADEADLTTGAWVTHLPRRDRSLSAAFGRMQSVWEKSATGRNLSLYSAEGTETIRRLAMHSGMPRRQAYALVNKWSMSTPGERWSMWRELATSMVEAGGLRDTAAKRAAVEFYTKGTISQLDHATRRGDEQALARIHERYASGDRNTINVEGRTMAAGILPMHMADGVTIPSMRDLKMLTGRVNFVNRALGLGRKHFSDNAYEWLRTGTRVWKSNVTSTFSNMERQILEGVVFLQALSPSTLARVGAARHMQALGTAEQRLVKNQAIKGARAIRDAATADDVAELERLQRSDPNAYRRHLVTLGRQAGLTDGSAQAMALFSENIQVAQLAGMSKSGLFLAGPLDMIRRGRLALNEKMGTREFGRNSAKWHDTIDRIALERITQSALDNLNTQASANRSLMSGETVTGADTTVVGAAQDVRRAAGNMWSKVRPTEDEITDAAARGVKMRRANMRPNAWTEVPTDSEVGRARWADEIERWLNDDIGHDVLRRLAHDHLIAPRQKVKIETRLLNRYRNEALNSPEILDMIAKRRNARIRLSGEKARIKTDKSYRTREGPIRKEIADLNDAIKRTRERIAQSRLRESPVDFDPARSFSRLRASEEAPMDSRVTDIQNRMDAAPIADELDMVLDDKQMLDAASQEEHFFSDSVEDMVAELLERNDTMKMFSARMNHDSEGRAIRANDSAGLAAARQETARVIVEEAKHLLGLKSSVIDGQVMVHDSLQSMLERVFNRQAVRTKDLRGIPDDVRPPTARSPEYIPSLDTMDKSKARAALNRAAAIQYDTFVGRPMQKLWMQPNFQAQMHTAYQILDPVADALIERGMDAQSAALFLEHTASQYATRAVFYTTDNPAEHSAFVELADNHLMFVRSMEDFFRRLGDVVSVNPGKVARSWLFVEAGITSGAMYQVPGFSEEDDAEWFFTYPGSALGARVASDGLRAMGWGDGQVRVPVYSGANAPVRFLNPTLANPIGTSSNPIFAFPLRAIRDYLLPTAWAPSINEKITALEGAEEGFATKNSLRSLMPTWAARVYDGLDWSETNAKLMSSFYAAYQTADAAGIIPGEEASPDAREDATHSIRQLAINNLVMRTLGGLFLPSSPWNIGMQTEDTPQTNAVAMRDGVLSIRGEWFELLEDYSKKFGPTAGLGAAHAEWARRYPKGRGIVNPESYTVGTYKTVNPDSDALVSKAIPRTDEMVDFFTANRKLYENYGAILPYLVPPIGDRYFDTEANQTLFQMGIIEKKGMEEFARDVRSAQNIQEFYRKQDEKEKAVALASGDVDKEAINKDWYDFQRRWETAYPASARKRDMGSNPDYVHDTLASSVGAFLKDPDLPSEMAAIKPAVQEMYNDYQTYRTDFMAKKPWEKEPVNKSYWNLGDSKWFGTDMEPLWRAFRVYEGRN